MDEADILSQACQSFQHADCDQSDCECQCCHKENVMDQADIEAEKVLPCSGIDCGINHDYYCPAEHRLAVAALIREKDAEIERLKTANGQVTADMMGCRDGALLRDLRAQLAACNEAESEIERQYPIVLERLEKAEIEIRELKEREQAQFVEPEGRSKTPAA